MVDAEPLITERPNERVLSAERKGDRIVSVMANSTLTGARSRYRGKVFIDGTGDGWLGYFVGAAHASRHHHAAAFRCDSAQIGEVCDFARGDFPKIHLQFGKNVDGNEVERCGKETDATGAAVFGQSCEVVERQENLPKHVELASAGARRVLLIVGFGG